MLGRKSFCEVIISVGLPYCVGLTSRYHVNYMVLLHSLSLLLLFAQSESSKKNIDLKHREKLLSHVVVVLFALFRTH